ncbi:hypothetical protein ACF3DV_02530 [Chlorogloeopsis fritschii PCC 9212]|uniref:Uncharacterized protein n=1 Tax=Chlorogloeopsis fritschii PCC 6912 TaxID=211165 RepID=A0A433N6U6_CHLFR|nr:hypothetical protein [Chlorogloeopsis fritschii]RUR77142.1 hypothetical protein PCC6912_41010 [Chlorogloeopsis fritschii PCC 6912]
MVVHKKTKEKTKFRQIKGEVSNPHNLTRLNVEKLKEVLSYFSYLHNNREINDQAFESLVRYACSIFIEQELEVRIQETLERKLMQFLYSKFSDSTEDIEDLETAIYSLDISRLIRSK